MKLEWDEDKRLANLQKHGLDFWDVPEVFEEKHVVVPSAQSHGEERFLTLGKLRGRFVTVIYTMRGDARRIISFRRARDVEKRKYQELHSGRD